MEDFDVGQLAAYLHLTPDQVLKMAERDRIPARRVGGEWRFPEAEVHHWLEQRIGVANEEQLGKVEDVLRRSAGPDRVPTVAELIRPEAIAIPLRARTHGSVVRAMCELAAQTGLLWDAPAMAEAVRAREELHPTALDSGVALLHPRRPQTSILADSLIALGVCPSPIPFSGGGQLTDVFFLICSYDDRVHLRILAKLSRIIGSDDVLAQIRLASEPQAILQLISKMEENLYGPPENGYV